jgi:hypothetical protein
MLFPVSYDKNEQNRGKDNRYGVGKNDRPGAYHDSIDEPQNDADEKKAHHADRQIAGRLGLYGMYHLRKKRNRGKRPCGKAYYLLNIHFHLLCSRRKYILTLLYD